jgi:hypothetical protein
MQVFRHQQMNLFASQGDCRLICPTDYRKPQNLLPGAEAVRIR